MAWVDDEPALLFSYFQTNPLRGWGIVYILLVPQTAAATWGVIFCCASGCLLFPLVTLFICSGVVSLALCHTPGGEGRRFFLPFFSLSRFVCLFVGCVFPLSYNVYVVPVVSSLWHGYRKPCSISVA